MLEQPVVHVDEMPVQMLMPGTKKTHRSYVWAYATSPFCETSAVVYDLSQSRAGEQAAIRRSACIGGNRRQLRRANPVRQRDQHHEDRPRRDLWAGIVGDRV